MEGAARGDLIQLETWTWDSWDYSVTTGTELRLAASATVQRNRAIACARRNANGQRRLWANLHLQ